MKKILFALLACSSCSTAVASGMVEGNRLQMQVVYDGNISAKTTCPQTKDCYIDVLYLGRKYRITQTMLGARFSIIPRELALSYDRRSNAQQFGVWFEIVCDKYSESPSENYVCIALVSVEQGKLKELSTIRRAVTDDYNAIESVDLTKPQEK